MTGRRLAGLVVLLTAALGACGSSGDAESAVANPDDTPAAVAVTTTTADTPGTAGDASSLATAIGEGFAGGAGVELTEQQAACVGQALIDEFGLEALAEFGTQNAEPSAEELQRVVGAFESCEFQLGDLAAADGTGLAERFGAAVATGAGLTLTAEQQSCVGQGIIDSFELPRLVALGQSGATPTDAEITAVLSVFSTCGAG
jgi:hypothetical protein